MDIEIWSDTEIEISKDCTIFRMNVLMTCPICLKHKTEYDKHHVIWKCDGGKDIPENLLNICTSCHALMTFSREKEDHILNCVATRFAAAVHGINFVKNI